MKQTHLFLVFCLLAAGCSSQFEGIRMRARAPAIDEAFRKIGIAVGLEDFTLRRNDPLSRVLETAWRDVREDERGPEKGTASGKPVQVRLTLGLMPRGMMYDVLLGVNLRREDGSGTMQETAAPPGHPLTVKWRRILNALVEQESKEED
jgi:hypothetical protein